MTTLAARQLELIEEMAALDPPPVFMGGYAEEALLAGTVTRPHEDVDWLLPRRELDLRLAQATGLGFDELATIGEAAPGEPFYLEGENGDLRLDLGIADEDDEGTWMQVHRLFFELDGGREAPAGYRARMPDDTFSYPTVSLDGIALRVASPLALYQMRLALSSRGSFGEPSEKQHESLRRLREAFFPDRSPDELEPYVEPLTLRA